MTGFTDVWVNKSCFELNFEYFALYLKIYISDPNVWFIFEKKIHHLANQHYFSIKLDIKNIPVQIFSVKNSKSVVQKCHSIIYKARFRQIYLHCSEVHKISCIHRYHIKCVIKFEKKNKNKSQYLSAKTSTSPPPPPLHG